MTEHSDTANTGQSASVNWYKPIEAVHEDGRVDKAWVLSHDERKNATAMIRLFDGQHFHATSKGYIAALGWSVRNVCSPSTVTIPRMTEEQWTNGTYSRGGNTPGSINWAKEMGIIASPEYLLSQHCNITEKQAAKALEWVAENVK